MSHTPKPSSSDLAVTPSATVERETIFRRGETVVYDCSDQLNVVLAPNVASELSPRDTQVSSSSHSSSELWPIGMSGGHRGIVFADCVKGAETVTIFDGTLSQFRGIVDDVAGARRSDKTVVRQTKTATTVKQAHHVLSSSPLWTVFGLPSKTEWVQFEYGLKAEFMPTSSDPRSFVKLLCGDVLQIPRKDTYDLGLMFVGVMMTPRFASSQNDQAQVSYACTSAQLSI